MASTATGPVTARCPAGLLDGIRAATRAHGGWDETAALVAAALGRHLPSPDILTASERAGLPDRHAQHILHTEPDGSFSVVGVVWRPGQVTPIHDHVTWCVVGVIAGTEHEELFKLRGGDADGHLAPTATRENLTGSVTGFAPPGDIHRVRNTGQATAISIHIYGADISRLGTSVRRVYDLPIADPPIASPPVARGRAPASTR
jgi:3-mercaptopropionate dioxygenase